MDHDLLVLEDRNLGRLPETYKIVSNTSSLSYASAFEGQLLDVLDLSSHLVSLMHWIASAPNLMSNLMRKFFVN